jgi:hypothetical protein
VRERERERERVVPVGGAGGSEQAARVEFVHVC